MMTTGQPVCRDRIRAKRVLARLTSGGAGVAAVCIALALTATPALATASVKTGSLTASTVSASTVNASTGDTSTGKASSQAPTAADWAAYLDGPRHTSYDASQTVITPATAPSLTERWSQGTGAPYQASPTVADGRVYIGSENGWFYKLSMYSGRVLSKVNLGSQPALTCGAKGIASTATVAVNPRNKVLTVYVTGGDGYLYALKASNLRREWRSVIGIPSTKVNNYYDWSSRRSRTGASMSVWHRVATSRWSGVQCSRSTRAPARNSASFLLCPPVGETTAAQSGPASP